MISFQGRDIEIQIVEELEPARNHARDLLIELCGKLVLAVSRHEPRLKRLCKIFPVRELLRVWRDEIVVTLLHFFVLVGMQVVRIDGGVDALVHERSIK